ncbi:NAD(P)/FAD-dependent oxidoreductase [Limisalsivibrio acetivorans]|uniref:NAD(P)/FAD-dependent oxidoreductase n=1 Tax=Limisalsivibrio acetivorans TaxID=1304888 RepID=UPI0003B6C11F|nr:NAD(P)/FAD-dependent oxidoreductase [Limisalsivibrio acetivorans]
MSEKSVKKVVIVGGGFVGLNAAKILGGRNDVEVTLIDKKNHHLFQPLLYQVAMAGLSPAEIAVPIRSILAEHRNIQVIQDEVTGIDRENSKVETKGSAYYFDYLILACGARHSYFGNDEWEKNAPGLKTLEQATEIRRRVLSAFEEAEKTDDRDKQRRLLTFVVVGGGPTGVELAGAIGEMSRYTLARDFRNIDAKLTRVILLEGGDGILPSFSPKLTSWAVRAMEELGVQVWTKSMVTCIDEEGVSVGNERIECATVLWAAGVSGSELGRNAGLEVDRACKVKVNPDLSIPGHTNIFAAGDMASCIGENAKPLPGIAPVAMQQGNYLGELIISELDGKKRRNFVYKDKGQMATIGRSRAITEMGRIKLTGFSAWAAWLLVHIYYLAGFRNRFAVVSQWAWSYLTFRRGARLILGKDWRFYK